MDETPMFPEWQTAIRQAQQITRQIRQQAEEDAAEINRLAAIQRGQELQRALAYLGVVIHPPTTGEITMDGIRLVLHSFSSNAGSEMRLCFNIAVSSQVDGFYNTRYVDVGWRAESGDWREERTLLADAIDSVTEAARSFVEWEEERDIATQPTSQPTTAERLVDLIREIIRDETTIGNY